MFKYFFFFMYTAPTEIYPYLHTPSPHDALPIYGSVLGNGTGLIDADYQGPLMISAFHRGREAYTIEPGDRIAQLVVTPIVRATLQVVDTFTQSARGAGGFGHPGVR